VLGHHIARRDADALNEDVRRHDSGERVPEHPRPRRVGRQVAAEVSGVTRPRHRQAERDGHLEHERADEIGTADTRRCHDLMSPNKFHRERHERHEQHDAQDRLQPVDQLVAEEADRTLHAEDDQHGHPERNTQEHGQGFSAEQSDQGIPRDRGQPLQCGGQHDRATERHPRIRQLASTRPRAPCRQVPDHQRAQHRADHHRQQSQPEAQPEHDRERAGENHGHVHLWGEPHREQPGGRTVPLILCDGRDAVRLDGQIPGTCGSVTGEGRFGQSAHRSIRSRVLAGLAGDHDADTRRPTQSARARHRPAR
jgi:hypothetical protein